MSFEHTIADFAVLCASHGPAGVHLTDAKELIGRSISITNTTSEFLNSSLSSAIQNTYNISTDIHDDASIFNLFSEEYYHTLSYHQSAQFFPNTIDQNASDDIFDDISHLYNNERNGSDMDTHFGNEFYNSPRLSQSSQKSHNSTHNSPISPDNRMSDDLSDSLFDRSDDDSDNIPTQSRSSHPTMACSATASTYSPPVCTPNTDVTASTYWSLDPLSTFLDQTPLCFDFYQQTYLDPTALEDHLSQFPPYSDHKQHENFNPIFSPNDDNYPHTLFCMSGNNTNIHKKSNNDKNSRLTQCSQFPLTIPPNSTVSLEKSSNSRLSSHCTPYISSTPLNSPRNIIRDHDIAQFLLILLQSPMYYITTTSSASPHAEIHQKQLTLIKDVVKMKNYHHFVDLEEKYGLYQQYQRKIHELIIQEDDNLRKVPKSIDISNKNGLKYERISNPSKVANFAQIMEFGDITPAKPRRGRPPKLPIHSAPTPSPETKTVSFLPDSSLDHTSRIATLMLTALPSSLPTNPSNINLSNPNTSSPIALGLYESILTPQEICQLLTHLSLSSAETIRAFTRIPSHINIPPPPYPLHTLRIHAAPIQIAWAQGIRDGALLHAFSTPQVRSTILTLMMANVAASYRQLHLYDILTPWGKLYGAPPKTPVSAVGDCFGGKSAPITLQHVLAQRYMPHLLNWQQASGFIGNTSATMISTGGNIGRGKSTQNRQKSPEDQKSPSIYFPPLNAQNEQIQPNFLSNTHVFSLSPHLSLINAVPLQSPALSHMNPHVRGLYESFLRYKMAKNTHFRNCIEKLPAITRKIPKYNHIPYLHSNNAISLSLQRLSQQNSALQTANTNQQHLFNIFSHFSTQKIGGDLDAIDAYHTTGQGIFNQFNRFYATLHSIASILYDKNYEKPTKSSQKSQKTPKLQKFQKNQRKSNYSTLLSNIKALLYLFIATDVPTLSTLLSDPPLPSPPYLQQDRLLKLLHCNSSTVSGAVRSLEMLQLLDRDVTMLRHPVNYYSRKLILPAFSHHWQWYYDHYVWNVVDPMKHMETDNSKHLLFNGQVNQSNDADSENDSDGSVDTSSLDAFKSENPNDIISAVHRHCNLATILASNEGNDDNYNLFSFYEQMTSPLLNIPLYQLAQVKTGDSNGVYTYPGLVPLSAVVALQTTTTTADNCTSSLHQHNNPNLPVVNYELLRTNDKMNELLTPNSAQNDRDKVSSAIDSTDIPLRTTNVCTIIASKIHMMSRQQRFYQYRDVLYRYIELNNYIQHFNKTLVSYTEQKDAFLSGNLEKIENFAGNDAHTTVCDGDPSGNGDESDLFDSVPQPLKKPTRGRPRIKPFSQGSKSQKKTKQGGKLVDIPLFIEDPKLDNILKLSTQPLSPVQIMLLFLRYQLNMEHITHQSSNIGLFFSQKDNKQNQLNNFMKSHANSFISTQLLDYIAQKDHHLHNIIQNSIYTPETHRKGKSLSKITDTQILLNNDVFQYVFSSFDYSTTALHSSSSQTPTQNISSSTQTTSSTASCNLPSLQLYPSLSRPITIRYIYSFSDLTDIYTNPIVTSRFPSQFKGQHYSLSRHNATTLVSNTAIFAQSLFHLIESTQKVKIKGKRGRKSTREKIIALDDNKRDNTNQTNSHELPLLSTPAPLLHTSSITSAALHQHHLLPTLYTRLFSALSRSQLQWTPDNMSSFEILTTYLNTYYTAHQLEHKETLLFQPDSQSSSFSNLGYFFCKNRNWFTVSCELYRDIAAASDLSGKQRIGPLHRDTESKRSFSFLQPISHQDTGNETDDLIIPSMSRNTSAVIPNTPHDEPNETFDNTSYQGHDDPLKSLCIHSLHRIVHLLFAPDHSVIAPLHQALFPMTAYYLTMARRVLFRQQFLEGRLADAQAFVEALLPSNKDEKSTKKRKKVGMAIDGESIDTEYDDDFLFDNDETDGIFDETDDNAGTQGDNSMFSDEDSQFPIRRRIQGQQPVKESSRSVHYSSTTSQRSQRTKKVKQASKSNTSQNIKRLSSIVNEVNIEDLLKNTALNYKETLIPTKLRENIDIEYLIGKNEKNEQIIPSSPLQSILLYNIPYIPLKSNKTPIQAPFEMRLQFYPMVFEILSITGHCPDFKQKILAKYTKSMPALSYSDKSQQLSPHGHTPLDFNTTPITTPPPTATLPVVQDNPKTDPLYTTAITTNNGDFFPHVPATFGFASPIKGSYQQHDYHHLPLNSMDDSFHHITFPQPLLPHKPIQISHLASTSGRTGFGPPPGSYLNPARTLPSLIFAILHSRGTRGLLVTDLFKLIHGVDVKGTRSVSESWARHGVLTSRFSGVRHLGNVLTLAPFDPTTTFHKDENITSFMASYRAQHAILSRYSKVPAVGNFNRPFNADNAGAITFSGDFYGIVSRADAELIDFKQHALAIAHKAPENGKIMRNKSDKTTRIDTDSEISDFLVSRIESDGDSDLMNLTSDSSPVYNDGDSDGAYSDNLFSKQSHKFPPRRSTRRSTRPSAYKLLSQQLFSSSSEVESDIDLDVISGKIGETSDLFDDSDEVADHSEASFMSQCLTKTKNIGKKSKRLDLGSESDSTNAVFDIVSSKTTPKTSTRKHIPSVTTMTVSAAAKTTTHPLNLINNPDTPRPLILYTPLESSNTPHPALLTSHRKGTYISPLAPDVHFSSVFPYISSNCPLRIQGERFDLNFEELYPFDQFPYVTNQSAVLSIAPLFSKFYSRDNEEFLAALGDIYHPHEILYVEWQLQLRAMYDSAKRVDFDLFSSLIQQMPLESYISTPFESAPVKKQRNEHFYQHYGQLYTSNALIDVHANNLTDWLWYSTMSLRDLARFQYFSCNSILVPDELKSDRFDDYPENDDHHFSGTAKYSFQDKVQEAINELTLYDVNSLHDIDTKHTGIVQLMNVYEYDLLQSLLGRVSAKTPLHNLSTRDYYTPLHYYTDNISKQSVDDQVESESNEIDTIILPSSYSENSSVQLTTSEKSNPVEILGSPFAFGSINSLNYLNSDELANTFNSSHNSPYTTDDLLPIYQQSSSYTTPQISLKSLKTANKFSNRVISSLSTQIISIASVFIHILAPQHSVLNKYRAVYHFALTRSEDQMRSPPSITTGYTHFPPISHSNSYYTDPIDAGAIQFVPFDRKSVASDSYTVAKKLILELSKQLTPQQKHLDNHQLCQKIVVASNKRKKTTELEIEEDENEEVNDGVSDDFFFFGVPPELQLSLQTANKRKKTLTNEENDDSGEFVQLSALNDNSPIIIDTNAINPLYTTVQNTLNPHTTTHTNNSQATNVNFTEQITTDGPVLPDLRVPLFLLPHPLQIVRTFTLFEHISKVYADIMQDISFQQQVSADNVKNQPEAPLNSFQSKNNDDELRNRDFDSPHGQMVDVDFSLSCNGEGGDESDFSTLFSEYSYKYTSPDQQAIPNTHSVSLSSRFSANSPSSPPQKLKPDHFYNYHQHCEYIPPITPPLIIATMPLRTYITIFGLSKYALAMNSPILPSLMNLPLWRLPTQFQNIISDEMQVKRVASEMHDHIHILINTYQILNQFSTDTHSAVYGTWSCGDAHRLQHVNSDNASSFKHALESAVSAKKSDSQHHNISNDHYDRLDSDILSHHKSFQHSDDHSDHDDGLDSYDSILTHYYASNSQIFSSSVYEHYCTSPHVNPLYDARSGRAVTHSDGAIFVNEVLLFNVSSRKKLRESEKMLFKREDIYIPVEFIIVNGKVFTIRDNFDSVTTKTMFGTNFTMARALSTSALFYYALSEEQKCLQNDHTNKLDMTNIGDHLSVNDFITHHFKQCSIDYESHSPIHPVVDFAQFDSNAAHLKPILRQGFDNHFFLDVNYRHHDDNDSHSLSTPPNASQIDVFSTAFQFHLTSTLPQLTRSQQKMQQTVDLTGVFNKTARTMYELKLFNSKHFSNTLLGLIGHESSFIASHEHAILPIVQHIIRQATYHKNVNQRQKHIVTLDLTDKAGNKEEKSAAPQLSHAALRLFTAGTERIAYLFRYIIPPLISQSNPEFYPNATHKKKQLRKVPLESQVGQFSLPNLNTLSHDLTPSVMAARNTLMDVIRPTFSELLPVEIVSLHSIVEKTDVEQILTIPRNDSIDLFDLCDQNHDDLTSDLFSSNDINFKPQFSPPQFSPSLTLNDTDFGVKLLENRYESLSFSAVEVDQFALNEISRAINFSNPMFAVISIALSPIHLLLDYKQQIAAFTSPKYDQINELSPTTQGSSPYNDKKLLLTRGDLYGEFYQSCQVLTQSNTCYLRPTLPYDHTPLDKYVYAPFPENTKYKKQRHSFQNAPTNINSTSDELEETLNQYYQESFLTNTQSYDLSPHNKNAKYRVMNPYRTQGILDIVSLIGTNLFSIAVDIGLELYNYIQLCIYAIHDFESFVTYQIDQYYQFVQNDVKKQLQSTPIVAKKGKALHKQGKPIRNVSDISGVQSAEASLKQIYIDIKSGKKHFIPHSKELYLLRHIINTKLTWLSTLTIALFNPSGVLRTVDSYFSKVLQLNNSGGENQSFNPQYNQGGKKSKGFNSQQTIISPLFIFLSKLYASSSVNTLSSAFIYYVHYLHYFYSTKRCAISHVLLPEGHTRDVVNISIPPTIFMQSNIFLVYLIQTTQNTLMSRVGKGAFYTMPIITQELPQFSQPHGNNLDTLGLDQLGAHSQNLIHTAQKFNNFDGFDDILSLFRSSIDLYLKCSPQIIGLSDNKNHKKAMQKDRHTNTLADDDDILKLLFLFAFNNKSQILPLTPTLALLHILIQLFNSQQQQKYQQEYPSAIKSNIFYYPGDFSTISWSQIRSKYLQHHFHAENNNIDILNNITITAKNHNTKWYAYIYLPGFAPLLTSPVLTTSLIYFFTKLYSLSSTLTPYQHQFISNSASSPTNTFTQLDNNLYNHSISNSTANNNTSLDLFNIPVLLTEETHRTRMENVAAFTAQNPFSMNSLSNSGSNSSMGQSDCLVPGLLQTTMSELLETSSEGFTTNTNDGNLPKSSNTDNVTINSINPYSNNIPKEVKSHEIVKVDDLELKRALLDNPLALLSPHYFPIASTVVQIYHDPPTKVLHTTQDASIDFSRKFPNPQENSGYIATIRAMTTCPIHSTEACTCPYFNQHFITFFSRIASAESLRTLLQWDHLYDLVPVMDTTNTSKTYRHAYHQLQLKTSDHEQLRFLHYHQSAALIAQNISIVPLMLGTFIQSLMENTEASYVPAVLSFNYFLNALAFRTFTVLNQVTPYDSITVSHDVDENVEHCEIQYQSPSNSDIIDIISFNSANSDNIPQIGHIMDKISPTDMFYTTDDAKIIISLQSVQQFFSFASELQRVTQNNGTNSNVSPHDLFYHIFSVPNTKQSQETSSNFDTDVVGHNTPNGISIKLIRKITKKSTDNLQMTTSHFTSLSPRQLEAIITASDISFCIDSDIPMLDLNTTKKSTQFPQIFAKKSAPLEIQVSCPETNHIFSISLYPQQLTNIDSIASSLFTSTYLQTRIVPNTDELSSIFNSNLPKYGDGDFVTNHNNAIFPSSLIHENQCFVQKFVDKSYVTHPLALITTRQYDKVTDQLTAQYAKDYPHYAPFVKYQGIVDEILIRTTQLNHSMGIGDNGDNINHEAANDDMMLTSQNTPVQPQTVVEPSPNPEHIKLIRSIAQYQYPRKFHNKVAATTAINPTNLNKLSLPVQTSTIQKSKSHKSAILNNDSHDDDIAGCYDDHGSDTDPKVNKLSQSSKALYQRAKQIVTGTAVPHDLFVENDQYVNITTNKRYNRFHLDDAIVNSSNPLLNNSSRQGKERELRDTILEPTSPQKSKESKRFRGTTNLGKSYTPTNDKYRNDTKTTIISTPSTTLSSRQRTPARKTLTSKTDTTETTTPKTKTPQTAKKITRTRQSKKNLTPNTTPGSTQSSKKQTNEVSFFDSLFFGAESDLPYLENDYFY